VKATERALVAGQLALLGFSAMGGVMLSDQADWSPPGLFALLLVVAVVSEAFRLETKTFHISAAFLSLVLAMTLLGPSPAAGLGVVVMGVNALRRHAPWRHTVANVSTYAFFPLVGGAVFESVGGPSLLNTNAATYILLVFALFMTMNIVNFLLIAVDIAIVDGQSIPSSVRRIFLPVLPVEFATGLLTAGVAFGYQDRNIAAVGLLAIVGLVFQYLLRTALTSMESKDELEGRTRELAALQVGLLGTVLQTLSLRD